MEIQCKSSSLKIKIHIDFPENIERKLVKTYKFNRKRPIPLFGNEWYGEINNRSLIMYLDHMYMKIRDMKHETI